MIFNEPGTYPGIPGLFASCRVELDENNEPVESPLVPHPHFEPAPVEEASPVEEEPAQAEAQSEQEQQAPPQEGQASPPVLSLGV